MKIAKKTLNQYINRLSDLNALSAYFVNKLSHTLNDECIFFEHSI